MAGAIREIQNLAVVAGEAEQAEGWSRFAGTGFTHQAQGCSLVKAEADLIDRLDHGPVSLEKTGPFGFQGKGAIDVLQFDQFWATGSGWLNSLRHGSQQVPGIFLAGVREQVGHGSPVSYTHLTL